jgi:hypothetical protein
MYQFDSCHSGEGCILSRCATNLMYTHRNLELDDAKRKRIGVVSSHFTEIALGTSKNK